MNALWQNIQYKVLRSDSKLNLLIGINIIVYLLINVSGNIQWELFHNASIDIFSNEYLRLPSDLSKLPLRFWTPLTYMFMHDGVFHILFNMLWLYWFGQIFEDFLGKKRTFGLYLMGGLAGAFLFVLSYNTLPFFSHQIGLLAGASAAVMAIIVATATLIPNYSISMILIGSIKLKWLVLAFIIIDFIGIVGPNAGGEISHLGGALIGFVYIKQLQRGHDWIGSIANLFKSKSKLKIVSKNTSKNYFDKPRQEDIDLILDKISKSGYDSLSKQEKEILFRASKNEG